MTRKHEAGMTRAGSMQGLWLMLAWETLQTQEGLIAGREHLCQLAGGAGWPQAAREELDAFEAALNRGWRRWCIFLNRAGVEGSEEAPPSYYLLEAYGLRLLEAQAVRGPRRMAGGVS